MGCAEKEGEREEILDAAWGLWEFVEDIPHPSLIKASIFFIEEYGFDLEYLPPKLRDACMEKIQQSDELCWGEEILSHIDSSQTDRERWKELV